MNLGSHVAYPLRHDKAEMPRCSAAVSSGRPNQQKTSSETKIDEKFEPSEAVG